MDKTSKRPLLRLVKEEDQASPIAVNHIGQFPKPKSAFARQLTAFADDLDAQIALLLAQD